MEASEITPFSQEEEARFKLWLVYGFEKLWINKDVIPEKANEAWQDYHHHRTHIDAILRADPNSDISVHEVKMGLANEAFREITRFRADRLYEYQAFLETQVTASKSLRDVVTENAIRILDTNSATI